MKVPLYRHNLFGHDIDALGEEFKSVLKGMMLSTGSVCAEVQGMFADMMGVKHCLLTNNWTGAAIATLMSLDIGRDDEVIIPAMTFVATANSVEAVGAKTVLVDIDPRTKLINVDKMMAAITPRTKAVMPVHLYGQMVDVRKLRSLLPSHIHIIEDAAHCIEGRRDGYGPAQYSSAALFSFYNSKNMTTGEGGAMITNNDDLLRRFTTIYRHGIDLDGYKRHVSDEFKEPEAVTNGIKANMSDLNALLLKPQIKTASYMNAKRAANAARYVSELANHGLEFPLIEKGVHHAHHIMAVGIDPSRRSNLLKAMDRCGIRSTVQYKSVHMMNHYSGRYDPDDYPVSKLWGESVFSLPIFPDLSEEELSYVITTMKELLN